jgi:hypothetical protein
MSITDEGKFEPGEFKTVLPAPRLGLRELIGRQVRISYIPIPGREYAATPVGWPEHWAKVEDVDSPMIKLSSTWTDPIWINLSQIRELRPTTP